MKDEIKEMLQEIKETVDDYLKIYKLEDDMMYDTINYKASQWYALLDYITNLQEENERLKLNHKQLKDIEKVGVSNSKLIQENRLLISYNNDLQSRIEKAIEYINNNSYFEDNIVKTMIFKDYSSNLLNILQGVGKDE